MNVFFYCSSCKKKNSIKTKAVDRHEFRVQVGSDTISKNCTHCGTFIQRHIDKTSAEPEKWMYLCVIPLIVVLTAIVFFFGFLASLTFSLPIWMVFNAQKKASDFNKTRIST